MTVDIATSVELLASAQTAEGAFPASTVHDVYQYGWLRDGSWCAYALDRAGRADAAAAWHRWVAKTLLAHELRFEQAIQAVRTGVVHGAVMMPARFTLDGREESPGITDEEWPNFQTDCYGFWLWALADHITRRGRLDDTLRSAARLVIRYLLVAGDTPCYDCWEEHPGNVHTSSLASVAAGLRDIGALLDDQAAYEHAEQLIARIAGPGHTLAGRSSVSPATPGRRFPAVAGRPVSPGRRRRPGVPQHGDPDQRGTGHSGRRRPALPRRHLLRRERMDPARRQLRLGAPGRRRPRAERMLTWIEQAATPEGFLPEQVQYHVQSPYMLAYWREKWGATATPLLWSHAMHVVLVTELRD